MAERSSDVREVKLWDPLLRGFHWLLAFFVIAAWLLGNYGPTRMTLHFWCGYAVTFLLAFRLIERRCVGLILFIKKHEQI